MIDLTRESFDTLEDALRKEWLETNGIGGFASSTIVGVNTRRYHGLLVAATEPPVGRTALVSKLEDTITLGGQTIDLSANEYRGVVHPNGHSRLVRFRLDPFPIATYDLGPALLERSTFMVSGSNATVVQYELLAKGPTPPSLSGMLEVRPLLSYRDYHALGRERGGARSIVDDRGNCTRLDPFEGMPAVFVAHEGATVERTTYWYRGFELREEAARGFDHTEDLFSPCAFRIDLHEGERVSFIVATAPFDATQANRLRDREIVRRTALVDAEVARSEVAADLAKAADQYLVRRGEGRTVIAGYHWFGDWGRDTMIALPGLTLVTGRYDVAKEILLEFAAHVDQGMLPNRFPDGGEPPEYNNVDSTLWYFEAIRALLAYSGDYEWVRTNLYATLTDIVDWHERGTRYGIRLDDDGLITSGADGVQLTWMDARVGTRVITPRRGKPVEIQALWYNALRVMEYLAARFDDTNRSLHYGRIAERAKTSFNRLFWNADSECLFDAVDGESADARIRPNQILAVSLRHSMLDEERSRKVVETVERELLTPVGLRSLSQQDPEYAGRYEGDGPSRDAVYHQGTVWAWLLGPFVTAYVKTRSGSSEARAQAARWLDPLRDHLSDACLGHVSEIFDADAPHTPRGCAAQAWSVAEILRCVLEDVYPAASTTGER